MHTHNHVWTLLNLQAKYLLKGLLQPKHYLDQEKWLLRQRRTSYFKNYYQCLHLLFSCFSITLVFSWACRKKNHRGPCLYLFSQSIEPLAIGTLRAVWLKRWLISFWRKQILVGYRRKKWQTEASREQHGAARAGCGPLYWWCSSRKD